MKNIKMIMLLLAGSMFIPNVNAQTFLKRQGKATDVAISKKDGSVYLFGTSKNVFKYNPRTKRFSKFGPQTRDVNRITISDLNQIFASKINGRVERSNGSASWEFRKKRIKSAEYVKGLGRAAMWYGKQRKLEIKMKDYLVSITVPPKMTAKNQIDNNTDVKDVAIAIAKSTNLF